MTKHQATSQKYRPVLSALQIAKILELAKREQPLSNESMAVISQLSPFMAKIENAGITAAYTLKGRATPDLLSLLGGTPTANPTGPEALGLTRQVYWEQCYQAYNIDPASCSLKQIEGAKEWMYLNDLMSEEEKAEFESPSLSQLQLTSKKGE